MAFMPTAEIRAAANAINAFSELSGIMFRHALDGTQPAQAEIDRYSKAEVALNLARRQYIAIWRLSP